jgi:hypothetical protein
MSYSAQCELQRSKVEVDCFDALTANVLQGHVDMIAYLIEQGAQWPEQLWQRDTRTAGDYGAVSCWALPALQYAVAAGRQLGEWPVGLCDELIANNYAEEVEWLHTLEVPPCSADCTAKQQRSSASN